VITGPGDDDELVVPVGSRLGQQQVPGIQQSPGPEGRLPVPVRADGEDAVAAVELECPANRGR
jgi:hypothetical protein